MSELETRVKGCELGIKDLKKCQDTNYEEIRLDFAELRENHLPHMEERLEKKIDSGSKRNMWTYGIGIAIVSVIVALFGVLTLIGG